MITNRFMNRRHRVVVKYAVRKNLRDHIMIRHSRQEAVELFDHLQVPKGDTAILESYIEGHGWVFQEKKSFTGNPKLVAQ
jgi:hypothetical protein